MSFLYVSEGIPDHGFEEANGFAWEGAVGYEAAGEPEDGLGGVRFGLDAVGGFEAAGGGGQYGDGVGFVCLQDVYI